MSIIDLSEGISDAVEPTVMNADEEYQARVISCEAKLNKNNEPYMLPRFEVVDEPTAKEFSKYLPLLFDGQDAKKKNNAKLGLQRFFDAFGVVAGDDLDTEDIVGATGWVILGVEEDDQYGTSNYIKRFIAAK